MARRVRTARMIDPQAEGAVRVAGLALSPRRRAVLAMYSKDKNYRDLFAFTFQLPWPEVRRRLFAAAPIEVLAAIRHADDRLVVPGRVVVLRGNKHATVLGTSPTKGVRVRVDDSGAVGWISWADIAKTSA